MQQLLWAGIVRVRAGIILRRSLLGSLTLAKTTSLQKTHLLAREVQAMKYRDIFHNGRLYNHFKHNPWDSNNVELWQSESHSSLSLSSSMRETALSHHFSLYLSICSKSLMSKCICSHSCNFPINSKIMPEREHKIKQEQGRLCRPSSEKYNLLKWLESMHQVSRTPFLSQINCQVMDLNWHH